MAVANTISAFTKSFGPLGIALGIAAAVGVAAMIILSAVVIWQMSAGNYYMTF